MLSLHCLLMYAKVIYRKIFKLSPARSSTQGTSWFLTRTGGRKTNRSHQCLQGLTHDRCTTRHPHTHKTCRTFDSTTSCMRASLTQTSPDDTLQLDTPRVLQAAKLFEKHNYMPAHLWPTTCRHKTSSSHICRRTLASADSAKRKQVPPASTCH